MIEHRNVWIIDAAIPGDARVDEKELEKKDIIPMPGHLNHTGMDKIHQSSLQCHQDT